MELPLPPAHSLPASGSAVGGNTPLSLLQVDLLLPSENRIRILLRSIVNLMSSGVVAMRDQCLYVCLRHQVYQ